ncbi:antibiotic biosynthesis monooxygenase [Anabaena sp. PCC 7108]|uniref:antibiotic biosynthesis monooxygenase n=1 Tax=Anabaena sp. PCC 7108 TaxID=163908 RepID=UPI0003494593|nr:antibiotic biosynthesis monooxygenase [Anabaena sp. PCC 7108]
MTSENTPKIALDTDRQPITAAISHLVKPGLEQEYEQWLRDISAVAQQFQGHSGVSFIRPQHPDHPEYAIILRFDCYKHLKEWMDSPVRQRWLDKVKPLVQQDQNVQILTGLETWFTLPRKPFQQPPKRYKMAILTAVAVFAVAQILGVIIAPVLTFLPPLLRSLVLITLTVFCLTYLVMPRVTRLFYRWLYPKHS